jgi:hypothetical protein
MKNLKRAVSPGRPLQSGTAKPRPLASRTAEELMELAVEAAQSRHLPGFLEQFASRSARMLDASWGGVAVYGDAKRNFTK